MDVFTFDEKNQFLYSIAKEKKANIISVCDEFHKGIEHLIKLLDKSVQFGSDY